MRFEAQSDAKATLTPADPQSKAWGAAKPSDAKWTPRRRKLRNVSRPGGVSIGNVGRDAGTLTQSANLKPPI